jgi:hypothetical protein
MSEPVLCNRPSVIKTLDPRIQVNRERNYVAYVGSKSTVPQVITASSSTSISNVSFSQNLSEQFFLSRKMKVRQYVQIVLEGASAPPSYPSDFCLSAWPLQRISDNVQLSLNSETYNFPSAQVLPAMATNMSGRDLARYCSSAPVQPDYYRWPLKATLGSNIGPFANMGSGGKSEWQPEPRGAFRLVSIATSTNQITARFSFDEDILISPLSIGADDTFAFSGVNSLQLVFNTSVASRMFSYYHATNTLTGTPTVTYYQAPELLITTLTPQDISPDSSWEPRMPKYYPYFRANTIPTVMSASITDASSSSVQNSLRLTSIPSLIYIYMCKIPTLGAVTDADVNFRITSVSIQYGNTSGLLSQATPSQLYDISCRNGFRGTFNDWYTYKGSVLILNPALDLSLDASNGLAVGVNAPLNFAVTVNYTNQLGSLQYDGASAYTATNFAMYISWVDSGYVVVQDTMISSHLGNLSVEDVLQAPLSYNLGQALNDPVNPKDIYGGGFFSKLRSLAGPLIRNVAKDVILPQVQNLASKGIEQLGQKAIGMAFGQPQAEGGRSVLHRYRRM